MNPSRRRCSKVEGYEARVTVSRAVGSRQGRFRHRRQSEHRRGPRIGPRRPQALPTCGTTVVAGAAADRVSRIEAAGSTAVTAPFDSTTPRRWVAFDAAIERFGQDDILANNSVKFDMAGVSVAEGS